MRRLPLWLSQLQQQQQQRKADLQMQWGQQEKAPTYRVIVETMRCDTHRHDSRTSQQDTGPCVSHLR
jgi:hypothetical protein